MELAENKIDKININQKELSVLSLIEENCFYTNGYLPNEKEIYKNNEENKINNLTYSPTSIAFSPNYELNSSLKGCVYASEVNLFLDDEKVGIIKYANTFNNKNSLNVFNLNSANEHEQNPCISGKITIFNNNYKIIKRKLSQKIQHLNAKKNNSGDFKC